jgi:hypothetical protein
MLLFFLGNFYILLEVLMRVFLFFFGNTGLIMRCVLRLKRGRICILDVEPKENIQPKKFRSFFVAILRTDSVNYNLTLTNNFLHSEGYYI